MRRILPARVSVEDSIQVNADERNVGIVEIRPGTFRRTASGSQELSGRLVRPRVKSRRLQMAASILEDRAGVFRRLCRTRQQPVDVVHPEPDAFHVERADRARECFALLDKRTDIGVRGQLSEPGCQTIDM